MLNRRTALRDATEVGEIGNAGGGVAVGNAHAIAQARDLRRRRIRTYYAHSYAIISGANADSKEVNIRHTCRLRHRGSRIDGALKRKLILDECRRRLRADHVVAYQGK